jgi:DNA-directed RNA polymerase specialized sigma24 family protein
MDFFRPMSEDAALRRLEDEKHVNRTEGAADVLSADELREGFRLTTVQKAKLVKAARILVRGTDYEPDELISEAIVRALDGSRSCPRDVDPLAFLYNAMRSIASAAWKARDLRPKVDSIDAPHGANVAATLRAADCSAEDKLLAEEDAAGRLKALMDLFEADADALCVVMGDLDELRPEEIRDLCGIDEKAYPTVRRRIRRTIEREFPHGWAS